MVSVGSDHQKGERATHQPVRAVIWDYDGTLVDTTLKNLRVARAIMPLVSGRPLESFPALASVKAYKAADRRAANWRELNRREFGLNASQADEAGRLWAVYQSKDQTLAPFFKGLEAALVRLKGLPMAIFSQNSRQEIKRSLVEARLSGYFGSVIGYEEVTLGRQKPAPDGLLFCLSEMGIDQGIVFFVGDHDTDVQCANQANAALAGSGKAVKVVAIGAEFGEGGVGRIWSPAPDHVARRPVEVVDLVERYGR